MNKNDLRFIKTEKIIKQTFLDLINEKDYQKVTISEICKNALISRNTFYIHYQTIDDLINSIYQDIEADFQNTPPDINDIRKCTQWYIQVVNQNRLIISTLLKCPSLRFKEILFQSVIREPMSSVIQDFDILCQDIKVKLNISYMIDAMISYTKCWLDNYDKISIQDVCEDLYLLCDQPTELFYHKIKYHNKKS
ncbi:TetR/AcrR family transcriptional regulator [Candidatus Stoquefichus sp. SB1]|uniref:TetR/AcrR family transcriptional regulator n=1 Tax=Candidatus Stoquefichus sp. SB1 TaxID=1658109 RepID=UPI00067F401A|nr:TetR/AcrR family transcriptional regulator [Candidatus Stoquefichus sp. SB1]